MKGDYSRIRFDPARDFSGVFMQQGRVQLDADWNELVDIVERRLRAGTVDTIGTAAVPRETPDAFAIDLAGGTPRIGPGRMYVDGLLAENHGAPRPNPSDPTDPAKARLEFDPVLAERRGPDPVPYDGQPWFPNVAAVAPFPTDGGPHLVYLDVWQREVTPVEDEDLVEVAVGVDTTTRRQTAWQVRVLEDVGTGTTCATPDVSIPGWTELTAPSAARLTTEAVGVPEEEDPCLTPPAGGFKGLENRLYRVEIHDPGEPGTATWKWSRDNGSIATTVVAIPDLDRLVVARVGRDRVLRFRSGDWIEITDDWRELSGQPGVMARIEAVDDPTRTITLAAPIPSGLFPTGTQDATDPARHTRIRRWDQAGEVRDTDGTLLADLGAAGSTGVIPVPPDGTSVVLEDGVQVTFSTDPEGGSARSGDYWSFAARTLDASVEELRAAAPRGVHHHYARLAVVTLPDNVLDCRTHWPPEATGDGGCECTACVSPEGGGAAIQEAINRLKADGATICLGPGVFNLGREPIRISGARALRIRGQGWMTQLVYLGPGPAIVIEGSIDVQLERLAVLTTGAREEGGTAIDARNCAGLTVERTVLLQLGAAASALPAVGLSGVMAGVWLRENVIVGGTGIANGASGVPDQAILPLARTRALLTLGLFVEENFVLARLAGVHLERTTIHAGQSRIAANFVAECGVAGIAALGSTVPAAGLHVADNTVQVRGIGIAVATDGTRVEGNNVVARGRASGDGIRLLDAGRDGLDGCQVVNNRVVDSRGDGISIQTFLRSALIKQNVIEGTRGGIVMGADASADVLDVVDNQLLRLAPEANDEASDLVGIRLVRTAHATVANNGLVGFAQAAVQNPSRTGIQVVGPSRSVRVAGNHLADIGPASEFVKEGAGIACAGPFERLSVVDNRVRRALEPTPAGGRASWRGIVVEGPVLDRGPVHGFREADFFVLENVIFAIYAKRVLQVPVVDGHLAVRGNQVDTYGLGEAVAVRARAACLLADNQCLLAEPGRASVATVEAASLAATSNYLVGPTDIALNAQVRRAAFTVVGNITRGVILVNGSPLGAPWQALNAAAV